MCHSTLAVQDVAFWHSMQRCHQSWQVCLGLKRTLNMFKPSHHLHCIADIHYMHCQTFAGLLAVPTLTGESVLNPFHQYGTVQHLRNKPVTGFQDSDQFLLIAAAEKEGLLKVTFKARLTCLHHCFQTYTSCQSSAHSNALLHCSACTHSKC